MPARYWTLYHTGCYHAWNHGAQRTLCKRIHADDLRLHPTERIHKQDPQTTDTWYGECCATCLQRANLPPVLANSKLSADASQWLGLLRRHATHVRVRVGDKDLTTLSQMLGDIGGPSNKDARQVFDQIKVLLLTPVNLRTGRNGHRRTIRSFPPGFRSAVAKLRSEPGSLMKVALAVKNWCTTTGRKPEGERYRADRVVEVMLAVPNSEPYTQHLQRAGLHHLAAMFHPNTLARAKRESAMRGMFSGNGAYADAAFANINVITT